MKIEPGTTSPAQLATETGTVMFEGTYTECAKVIEEINNEMQPAHVTADHLDNATKASLRNLGELWSLLGADNQQEAVDRARQLMGTPCAEALGKAQKVPIPPNVYYKPDSDNFYANTGDGLGEEFYTKWKPRACEFPEWVNGIEGRMARNKAFEESLGRQSPYEGPFVSCDARPVEDDS